MIYLKQSTASQEVPLGPFLDSSDGDTEETGLTINNTDIKLWKHGATTLASKNSGGATHISNGIYYAVLDATDTNTLGPLVIFVHVSGALAVKINCVVLAANVYDSLVAATDDLDVQVSGLDADVITASVFDESTAFPLASADSGATEVARTGADGDTLETLSDQVDGVQSDVSGLPSLASIISGVDTTITDYRLDQLLSAALAAPVAGSLFSDLTEDDGGTQRFTANALEESPGGGGATPDVNVVSISGDAAAADNLEADYDGTGYAKTGSSIGGVSNPVIAYLAGLHAGS